MSDRIALLHKGVLEQVAPPQEIYTHPATSYAAQFIGHTNLLKAEVRGGIARCSSLAWSSQVPDGPAVFSLRPENIRVVPAATPGAVYLRGKVIHQAFHGATELIRVECAGSLVLTVRTASEVREKEEVALEFSPADVVAVRESAERV